jgi:hypothetical protein
LPGESYENNNQKEKSKMTNLARDGAPKNFEQVYRGDGIRDEHNSPDIPCGTIKTAVRSVTSPPVHPAASFHEILPGIGKCTVEGISRTGGR